MKLKWNQSKLPKYYDQHCRMQKFHSSFHIFLSGFSFADIDSKVREKMGPSLIFVTMATLSQTFKHLFAVLHLRWLLNITQLLEISTWLHFNIILIADFSLIFAVSYKQRQFQAIRISYALVNLNISSHKEPAFFI